MNTPPMADGFGAALATVLEKLRQQPEDNSAERSAELAVFNEISQALVDVLEFLKKPEDDTSEQDKANHMAMCEAMARALRDALVAVKIPASAVTVQVSPTPINNVTHVNPTPVTNTIQVQPRPLGSLVFDAERTRNGYRITVSSAE